LTVGPSMTAEAEKHTDGEIDSLFSLTLWMRDMLPLTIVDCLFFECLLCLMGCPLQGGNAAEAKFIVLF
jgi:hypothetical protein